MALRFLKCTQEHIRLIETQVGEPDALNKLILLDPDYMQLLEQNFSLSAWDGHRIVGAAGVITVHPGMGFGWGLLDRRMAGKHMREITAKCKQVMDGMVFKRIETTVDYNFLAGHRWAKMLGFKCEAIRLEKRGFSGADESIYARVKKEA